MSPSRPLVHILKTLIEKTYGIPPLIRDLSPFIIGDRGFRKFYAGPDQEPEAGARVLLRDSKGGLRAAVYCPDALVGHLERHNPLHGLGDENIDAFAVLVEEIDHLLTLASRASEGRSVTLLELEHHANVTKYLAVVHFLGRQTRRRRVIEPLRLWARHKLFERYSNEQGDAETRYREAARLAWRYLRLLETLDPERRRTEIRAFHRRPLSENVRLAAATD